MSRVNVDFQSDDGEWYAYEHCENCGMEYEYFPDSETLNYWHDAVGLVSTESYFNAYDWRVLLAEHHTGACTV